VQGTLDLAPARAPSHNARRRALRRLLRSPRAVIGGGIVLVFAFLAIAAPLIAPYDPLASDWSAVRAAPSLAHPMGTDELGRDVMSRVIHGGRTSLLAGVVSVLIALSIGMPLGVAAGYFGGPIDVVISRFTDGLLACPQIMLAIAFATFLGPSLQNAMIAIGISTTPIFIRLARGQTLSVMVEGYIEAARAIGTPHRRLLVVHVLANIAPALVVQCSLSAAVAIIAEAGLSFLGLGQPPPAPSWGGMLTVAKNYMTSAPWLAFWPGLALSLVVLSFNLLGDGLREALDPRHG
jgi:peptide/nickel transport system permease protein